MKKKKKKMNFYIMVFNPLLSSLIHKGEIYRKGGKKKNLGISKTVTTMLAKYIFL